MTTPSSSAALSPVEASLAASSTAASSTEPHQVVFGLGSNLGTREETLHTAAELLIERAGLDAVRRSPLYRTAPLGPPQPDYLNAALAGQTTLPLRSLLLLALDIERQLGRVRDAAVRWGPRLIDIDLLWSDRLVCAEPGLTVPHAELTERAFALRPLLDVVPDARDPHSGRRYAELTVARAELQQVGSL